MRTLLAFLLAPLAAVAADPPKPPLVAPVDLTEWTPRPAVGKAEPYERMKDPEWDDKRFQLTDTGPVLNCTFKYTVGKEQHMAYKATVIKLDGGKAGIAFDRNTMKMAAAWTGGFVNISERRFGLLNTPTPKGEIQWALKTKYTGWESSDGHIGIPEGTRPTSPLPKEWAKYRGYYVHGNRVVIKYTVGDTEVLQTPDLQVLNGQPTIFSFIRLSAHKTKLRYWSNAEAIDTEEPTEKTVEFNTQTAQKVENLPKPINWLTSYTKPGPARWGKPLVTKLVRGSADGPFALDTLTVPYDNPFKALFFCTAVDFLPDGRVAVSTAHGDVWLVRIDEAKDECHWQRFATGLYQPMGVKVIDGKVHVLERGQLTRLHDDNADGEADFYECVNNDWHCSGGEHSYDTSLETDPQGNFYFHKTGDTDTPTGGCLMWVSKDGAKSEIFCTGFRHPIGLGVSPTGIVTGADQEGNWMPATRIDQYKKGGFYGDMRAHHRPTKPEKYDEPLCWLPREVDNSAGCQIWTPDDKRWGPLAGLPLHFSYGRCKLYVLLRQELGDTRRGDGGEPAGGSSQPTVQGGVAELPVRFLSGSRTGRFHPKDGRLYVVGLNGWQTAAKADGSLQRVRLTDKPLDVPVKMEVVPDGVKLTFSRELDAKAAADPANYRAAWWGYRWSGEYGSKRWKVSDPKVEGQDDVAIAAAELSPDGRTVHVKLKAGARPAQSMQLGYNLASKDTTKAVTGSVFLTIHKTGK